MNGIMNFNFLLGYLLARDRPKNEEKFNTALLASQFPSNSLIGTFILKNQIDKVSETENKLLSTDKQLKAKDDELKAKDVELKAKDVELEAKDVELEAKNVELEAKDDELKAKDDELAALNGLFSDGKNIFEPLTAKITDYLNTTISNPVPTDFLNTLPLDLRNLIVSFRDWLGDEEGWNIDFWTEWEPPQSFDPKSKKSKT